MSADVWTAARRILVVRLDNIGDIVMLSPALRALRRALPAAHISLLTSPAGATVGPLLPWIDEVLVRSVVWQDASGVMPLDVARETTLIDDLRSGHYDAALICTSFSQTPHTPAYACYLAGIPVRVGESKEFGGSVLSHAISGSSDATHQVDRNLLLLQATGIPATDTRLELHLSSSVQAEADELLRAVEVEPDEPYLVVAPGASCPARTYDPLRMAEAARLVATGAHLPVVVVGAERDHAACRSVLALASPRARIVSLVGRTSIPQLAAVIARCSLLLANDSGPMHLADAWHRPMVVTFSGTDLESQWRPRHSPAVLLRRPTFCSPCYQMECPYEMECLDIPAEEVAEAARAVLDQHLPAREPA